MSESRLLVELYGERLGALTRQRGGGASFVPEPAWVQRGFLPLLGVHWLIQRGNGERHANTHLPEWFENLLPERDSVLRERLARSVGLRGTASYDLLARLGHDLPGALVVRPEGDAHLKNWSFLLPAHQRPRLTPLYDQVCVVAWEKFGWERPDRQRPELSLDLGKSRRLSDLGVERFHLLAERVGWTHAEVEALVQQTLSEIFAALPRIAMPERMRVAVAEHARQVRLLFEFADFG